MGNRLGISFKGVTAEEKIIRQANNKIEIQKFAGSSVNSSPDNNSSRDHVSFSGINGTGNLLDLLPKWLEKVEIGGFFTEFLVVDMMGMIIPRTYQAFMRNREELGHLNYKAGVEEAIREFLTGPSMFLIPMAAAALSRKIFGPATMIELDTIDKYKDILKDVISENNTLDQATLKKSFYEKVLGRVFDIHKQKGAAPEEIEETIKSIIKELDNMSANASKNKPFMQKLKEAFGSSHNEPVEKIKSIVSSFNKKYNVNLDDTYRIQLIEQSLIDRLENTTKNHSGILGSIKNSIDKYRFGVENFATKIVNYGDDVIRKICEQAKPENIDTVIENVHKATRGGRKIINVLGIITVSAFLYCIPLLYKRNKEFPGIDGLVDQKDQLKANPTNPNANITSQNQNTVMTQYKSIGELASAFLTRKEAK